MPPLIVPQEIAIRVFRTAHELAMHTVAIYSYEDRLSAHRQKVGNCQRAVESQLIHRFPSLTKRTKLAKD